MVVDIDGVYARAIKAWGMDAQIDMVVEEAAELIQAIQKWKRHKDSYKNVIPDNVTDEMADMKIMLEQLALIGNMKTNEHHRIELQERYLAKILRLDERLKKSGN